MAYARAASNLLSLRFFESSEYCVAALREVVEAPALAAPAAATTKTAVRASEGLAASSAARMSVHVGFRLDQ